MTFNLTVRSAFVSPLKMWRGFSLDRRFATLALGLAVASTLAIGGWVAHRLEEGILSRSAGVASVYISDLVSPLVQDLVSTGQISEEGLEQLDSLLVTGALRLRVVAVKVWNRDGTVVFSTDPALIGHRFALEGSLANALMARSALK